MGRTVHDRAATVTRAESPDARRAAVAAALVVAADQASKSVALALFDDEDWRLGPVRLTVAHNSGGPFGLARGATLTWTILSVVVIAVLIAGFSVISRGLHSPRVAVAVGAAIGGGLGNLADRIIRRSGEGSVVDWISVDPYRPVFNVADIALRVGAIVVVVAALRPSREVGKSEGPPPGY